YPGRWRRVPASRSTAGDEAWSTTGAPARAMCEAPPQTTARGCWCCLSRNQVAMREEQGHVHTRAVALYSCLHPEWGEVVVELTTDGSNLVSDSLVLAIARDRGRVKD